MPERAVLFLQLGGPETLDEVPGFSTASSRTRTSSASGRRFCARRSPASIALGRGKASRKLYALDRRRLAHPAADRGAGRGASSACCAAKGRAAAVRAAMNCSAPLVEDVVAGARRRRASGRFLALPLYPQYSLTTTKGALERAARPCARFAPGARLVETGSWPTHPLVRRGPRRADPRRSSRSSPTRAPRPCTCSSRRTRSRRSSSPARAIPTPRRSRRASARSASWPRQSARRPRSPTSRSSAPSSGSGRRRSR